MPRRPRVAMGGLAYHVINRGAGRSTLFDDDPDYAAFERVLAQALDRTPGARLLAYCLMPNHWHLILWPRGDDDLSEFMRWLTVTHSQRFHAHHHTAGTGPVYQGRFKSFPIQKDPHLAAVLRYVERNALRARLVRRAENWRWGSLWRWAHRHAPESREPDLPALSRWPIDRPRNWRAQVNAPISNAELEALRRCVQRGTPFGHAAWVEKTAKKLGLTPTLRRPGRPRRKQEEKETGTRPMK